MIEDTVCINGNVCVDNFPFFMIQNQEDFADTLDGVIGMSPPIITNGPSFIGYLYAQGKLAQPIVSFQINLESDDVKSQAQFGYADS